MPPSASRSEARPRHLLLLLAAALAARLLAFTGATTGDATIYSQLATLPAPPFEPDLREAGTALPRVALLGVTRLAYRLLGPGEAAASIYPLACSLGTVALAWWFGCRLLGASAGLLAGALAALCPLQLPHASVLGPDIPMAFWLAASAAALWLQGAGGIPGVLWSASSGGLLALAVANRESALAMAPFALASAVLRPPSGWRIRSGLALLAGLAFGLWAVSPDFRLILYLKAYLSGSYLRRDGPPEQVAFYLKEMNVTSPWHRWFDAVLLLVPGDHRFPGFGGIATLGVLAGAFALWRRRPGMAWLALWGLGYAFFLLFAASPYTPGRPVLVAQARYLHPCLVPFCVLSAWAALPLARRFRLLLPAWGLYLAYAAWVLTLQLRGTALPYREVAAWVRETRPGEVYAEAWGAGAIRMLLGHPETPRVIAWNRKWDPAVAGLPLVHDLPPGALVLLDPDDFPETAAWTELRRWRIVTEVGPRARLCRLLGRPLPPLPSKVLVARRAPPAT